MGFQPQGNTMADLTDISDADLSAEMQRRAAEVRAAQFAPVRALYEPLKAFMDDEEPQTLSTLIAMCAAPRQGADADSPIEQNLSAMRRVLANTKTVWDNSVGLAFDADEIGAATAQSETPDK